MRAEMDLVASQESESRFEAYVDGLVAAIGMQTGQNRCGITAWAF